MIKFIFLKNQRDYKSSKNESEGKERNKNCFSHLKVNPDFFRKWNVIIITTKKDSADNIFHVFSPFFEKMNCVIFRYNSIYNVQISDKCIVLIAIQIQYNSCFLLLFVWQYYCWSGYAWLLLLLHFFLTWKTAQIK